jgi:hypothetical protein
MAKSKLLLIFIGIAVIGIILVVVGVRTNVRVFRNPPINKISHQCDDKGLRQAELIWFDSGGPERSSIQAVVNLGCDPEKKFDLKNSVFLAIGDVRKEDVQIKWTTFDTLTIKTAPNLMILQKLEKVEFEDATLNVNVKFVVDQGTN